MELASTKVDPKPDRNERSFEERLIKIKGMIDETNKAVKETLENIQFINENESTVKELDTSELCSNYIMLDYAKPKEFIESVQMMVDFINNYEQNVKANEAMSLPRLKALLQNLKTCAKLNENQLNQLDGSIANLKSLEATVKEVSNHDNSVSL